jgi:hypothetical protein
MKKGKSVKIGGFRNMKVSFGTVDCKNLKSIYLNLQTWVEPKEDHENWVRIVSNLRRSFKHSVLQYLDKSLFQTIYIVDLDLRTSGLQPKKKSFMNLEINLYLDQEIDFKSPKLKKTIKNLSKNIYDDVLFKNEYFKCFLTKNGNTITKKPKTEIV